MMKIVFKLPEDDPKNPGVIADCTGDNAGDSVGPTADGFETYGVTGVALIAFLALALAAKQLVEPARILEVDTEALRKLGKRERAFLDEVAAFPRPAGGTRSQRKRAKDEA